MHLAWQEEGCIDINTFELDKHANSTNENHRDAYKSSQASQCKNNTNNNV